MVTGFCFIVLFIFVKKCFGIIHQLPDQLLKWIGGGDNALGQFAGEFGGAAEKGAGVAAAVAGGVASRGTSIGAEKLQGKVNEAKAQAGTAEGLENKGFAGFLARNSGGSGQNVGGDGRIRNEKGNESFTKQKANEAQQQAKEQQTTADKAFDANFGSGASAVRDNAINELTGSGAGGSGSPEEISSFSQAFSQGLSDAKTIGGTQGAQQFLEQFSAAAPSGTSFSEASKSAIPKGIEGAIASQTSQKGFSSNAASVITNVATNGGKFDAGVAKNAISSMDKMAQTKGKAGVDSVNAEIDSIYTNTDPVKQKSEFNDTFK